MSLLQEIGTHGLADCEFNRKLKERHYKIINILEGFQNSYKQNAWQVWALFDDGQRVFCGVFQTKAKAHDYIKENEQ